MNKKMRVDEENKVTERRKVNLRRVLQKGVNFFDALQTEQTDLTHGASVVRSEVQKLGSMSGLRGAEGSDHAEQEVVMRSGWKQQQQNLVEAEV